MKAIFAWIAKVVGAAIALVLVITLLPYTTDLANLIMPDITSAAERTAGEISHNLSQSRRLESIRITDEGTCSNDFDVAGVYVGGVKFDYQYNASFGIDLEKVKMIVNGSRITFILPEPELIMDEIIPSNVARRDFLVNISDSDYEKIRLNEKLACRAKYLPGGERADQLWDATKNAFADTIEPWLSMVDSRLTFEYASDQK